MAIIWQGKAKMLREESLPVPLVYHKYHMDQLPQLWHSQKTKYISILGLPI